MVNTYSAGGSITAWCTKCKLDLEHTIIAMVDNMPKKVKCNTCNGEHNYRVSPSERPRTGSSGIVRKSRTKQPTYEDYISRLAGGDTSRAKKYDIKGTFEKDSLIDHPRFGIGVVLSVITPYKIEVLFKDGPRLLIQNQH